MSKIINFANEKLPSIFAQEQFQGYETMKKVMIDVGSRKFTAASVEEGNDKIRELMFQITGTSKDSTRKELRKAIRRHKLDIFEVIEETVQSLLVTGWGENPFFNRFVDMKNGADGDVNEWWTKDDIVLTVAEFSGGHHNLIRQKLGAGKTYTVKTSWYGVKVYTDFELFMAGRIDWADFIQNIYKALDKKVNDMVYKSIGEAADKLPTGYKVTGTLTLAQMLLLMEDVQAATGSDVMIMGSKSALSKLSSLSDTNWISNEMKNERNTTGKLGIWEGAELLEIPQSFADKTLKTKLVDPNMLLVMPTDYERFIKVYNEGDAEMFETTDAATNRDMTIEAEYQQKMGFATVINGVFGYYDIA